jgi:NADPH:quinone reductase
MKTQTGTMTAIKITTPGGPEVLIPEQLSIPRPGMGQILIKVAAAGVNRPDILQRLGNYAPPPGASLTPGLEVAGEVIALGEGCVRFRVGDKVCALVPGGGYADYCLAAEINTLPLPKGLSLTEAGAIPETYFTVWTNVFQRGGLRPGEALLVHGGTSGIGTTAIMLAKAFGAKVIATAGSDDKCDASRKLGADIAINYRTRDFADELIAQKIAPDVILDMVGGDYTNRNLKIANKDGRIVQIAFLRGAKTEIDLSSIMIKRLTLTGSTLRPRSPEEKAIIAKELEEKVWPLLEQGKCKPVIHATFPLEQSAEAHRMMESSQHTGKIVLLPSPA